MKCVIILDEALPVGLLANTAAALGLSLGNHVSGLIGPDVADADGHLHKGVTAVPIPILATNSETLKNMSQSVLNDHKELMAIGFSKTAQQCNSYELYIKQVAKLSSSDLEYLGLCIYGPKQRINQLCGQMKLLR